MDQLLGRPALAHASG